MKIYLIGLPGSGKSFLGKELSALMSLPFIDLDEVLEGEEDMKVRSIFASKGEDYFRRIEANALRMQSERKEFVMSCGGGTPCFLNNMKFINKAGKSVFLNTPVEEIVKRLDADEKGTRPLINVSSGKEMTDKLNELLVNRLPFYTQADIIASGPEISATEILNRLSPKN